MAKESRWTIVAQEALDAERTPPDLRPLTDDECVARYIFSDGHEGEQRIILKFPDKSIMQMTGRAAARDALAAKLKGEVKEDKVVAQRITV